MSDQSITPIWTYYAKETIDERDEAGCSFLSVNKSAAVAKCRKKIKIQYGSTSGLRRHLENKHFGKYLLFKKEQEAFEKTKEDKKKVNIDFLVSTKTTLQGLGGQQKKLTDFKKWGDHSANAQKVTKEIGNWLALAYNLTRLQKIRGLEVFQVCWSQTTKCHLLQLSPGMQFLKYLTKLNLKSEKNWKMSKKTV